MFEKILNLIKPTGANINYTTAAGNVVKTSPQVTKMVVDLIQNTQYLTKKDIGDWHQAWQFALNVDNPARRYLYDCYSQAMIDMHLSGCIGQRKSFVKRKAFRLVDVKTGKEVPEATEILENEWFKDLMDYCLDSRYWGYSLIELGTPSTNADGKNEYSYAKLVPRKHVCPEYGVILTHETDLWQSGYDYRNSPMADWVIECGRPDDLGILLRACTQTIPKKNMLAFWDQFGEIFGMPIRIARTTSQDKNTQSQIEDMLSKMGAAAWGLFQEGTDIEIKESTKGDAFNVYDQRIERANSELSKGVLLQTMTIDNGASLSQGQVHYKVFQNVIEEDADMIRDMVNNKLLPRMVKHGFPVQGLRFEWDDSIDYTPEQSKAIEEMLLQYYDIPATYFTDKYGIAIDAVKQPVIPSDSGNPDNGKPEDDDPEEKKNKDPMDKLAEKLAEKLSKSFFV